ncbi:trace amine-associated receptor 13c-like [Betta splendens]|uniref:Trace amine-associated receptor 13c-like n=1 Tax=Betta splendens TaxID=158456 RepID=A0A6P7LBS6_BETSP|nr:trace amine-associated receptor 13c-like [Betta splendens]XP_028992061.1 trace amine-associated receptor 13c-like [Betta splendens]
MELHSGSELCFPQLLNSSCTKPVVSWSELVFLRCLLSSVSVLTVTLNLLVIVSVSHFRQLHTPTNLLLLSLAVSDFLVGFVFLPGEVLRKSTCWLLGDLMCSLFKFTATICVAASTGNMVLISADRFAAICDPLHYHSRVTVGKVRLCIFLCWLCCTLYNILFIKDDLLQTQKSNCRGQCVFKVEFTPVIVDLIVGFILPVSAIVVLYMRVFVVAVSQARSMRSHVTAVTLHRSVTVLAKKSELKAARTLGVLVVVFLFCFCPYYCVTLTGENLLHSSYGVFVLSVFCLNSCVNPVIYALFYPWFRRAVKLIVTLQILQPGSREANVLWRGRG